MFEAIIGGVTELMGIATLPEYRRRGFAAYLTAAMAQSAFTHGATLVFLCAVSEEAGRVYQARTRSSARLIVSERFRARGPGSSRNGLAAPSSIGPSQRANHAVG